MKKALVIWIAVLLFVSSSLSFSVCANAEEYPDLSDEEIAQILTAVTDEQLEAQYSMMPDGYLRLVDKLIDMEMERRGLTSKTIDKDVTVPIGTYTIGEDIPAGTYSITTLSEYSFSEVTIYNWNGQKEESHLLFRGDKIGKIVLKERQTIEIGYSSVLFSGYKGLGFDE